MPPHYRIFCGYFSISTEFTAGFVISNPIPIQCLVHFNITFPSSELLVFANADANVIDAMLHAEHTDNLLHYSQFVRTHIVLQLVRAISQWRSFVFPLKSHNVPVHRKYHRFVFISVIIIAKIRTATEWNHGGADNLAIFCVH